MKRWPFFSRYHNFLFFCGFFLVYLPFCFCGFFFFLLKTLLYLLFKCLFFGEKERPFFVCVTRVPRFFISITIKGNILGLQPSVGRFGQLLFFWTCQIIPKIQKQLVQFETQNDSGIGREFMGIEFVEVHNKSKVLFSLFVETPTNSTYIILVLIYFRYAHSYFHHLDFINQAGTGINLYSISTLNKTRKPPF